MYMKMKVPGPAQPGRTGLGAAIKVSRVGSGHNSPGQGQVGTRTKGSCDQHCTRAKGIHLKGPLHRGSSTILGQQARMNVDSALSGYLQELLWQEVAVCCCDAQVWFQLCQRPQQVTLHAAG